MTCRLNDSCRGHCVTPWECGGLFVSNLSEGGECVNVEHQPRPMPIEYAGPEPITLPWWAVAAITILALIGAGALYSHFFH